MTIPDKFSALVARDGVVAVEQADPALLYDGKVGIKVAYSGINYKDALAVTGKGKILRASPLIPGIDYAGEVVESGSDAFAVGDRVILTGNAVGEKHSGGYAAYARADADWLVSLPDGMNEQQAMVCGTAGLTAALCVLALHDSGHVAAGGKVVVSGASGGVGSFAVALLSRLGYTVTAGSRAAAADYVRSLGAADIITREELSADARPLEKSRWDGAVDCVGGKVLARILAEMSYGGVVAACGLAGSHELNTTVMPFILRGVRLDGVDSVMIPRALRQRGWELLATQLNEADYARIAGDTVSLSDIVAAGESVLAGDNNGRIVVNPQL